MHATALLAVSTVGVLGLFWAETVAVVRACIAGGAAAAGVAAASVSNASLEVLLDTLQVLLVWACVSSRAAIAARRRCVLSFILLLHGAASLLETTAGGNDVPFLVPMVLAASGLGLSMALVESWEDGDYGAAPASGLVFAVALGRSAVSTQSVSAAWSDWYGFAARAALTILALASSGKVEDEL